jgi:hypothetical protein
MLAETTIRHVARIAEDAFVVAYPLVLMSRRMAHLTAVFAPDPHTMRAPVNALVHGRDTPDTLRSSAWLDLAAEPMVISVPDTCGRYYVLWLRDAWNTVFASVGARTTGTTPRAFAVVDLARHGAHLPPGLTPIAAPTTTVHLAGCIEAVGETDDEAFRRANDGFGLVPLSRWQGDHAPVERSAVVARDPAGPVEQVDLMDAQTFFSEVSRLVGDNPPDLAGRAALDRLPDVGAWESLTPELRAGLRRGVERGRAAVRAEAERPPGEAVGRWWVSYGWSRPGADHLRRAGAARAARNADPDTDALHAVANTDSAGRQLNGRSRYLLRFAPDAPPPVHGFWSLTTGAGSPAGTHSTGDLQGLTIDPDGSLPIHIQHAPPARARRSNWLPAPRERFGVALHLYWPAEEALQRRWSPPSIVRVA